MSDTAAALDAPRSRSVQRVTMLAHIKNLRKKIEPDPANPIYIQTVYGVGYRFGA